MIAVDTNVLLRYLLADDARQFSKAKKLVSENRPVLITDVVLVESIWTLSGKRYGLDKAALSKVIRGLFGDAAFMFEDNQVVWSSLRDYEGSKKVRGKDLDFSDALIVNKARYSAELKGVPLAAFYSFDKAVEQLTGAQIG